MDDPNRGEAEETCKNASASSSSDFENISNFSENSNSDSETSRWVFVEPQPEMVDSKTSNEFYLNCFQETVQELNEEDLLLGSDSDGISIISESDITDDELKPLKEVPESTESVIQNVSATQNWVEIYFKRYISSFDCNKYLFKAGLTVGVVVLAIIFNSVTKSNESNEKIIKTPPDYAIKNDDFQMEENAGGEIERLLTYCLEIHKSDDLYVNQNVKKCFKKMLKRSHNPKKDDRFEKLQKSEVVSDASNFEEDSDKIKEEMLLAKEEYLKKKEAYLNNKEIEMGKVHKNNKKEKNTNEPGNNKKINSVKLNKINKKTFNLTIADNISNKNISKESQNKFNKKEQNNAKKPEPILKQPEDLIKNNQPKREKIKIYNKNSKKLEEKNYEKVPDDKNDKQENAKSKKFHDKSDKKINYLKKKYNDFNKYVTKNCDSNKLCKFINNKITKYFDTSCENNKNFKKKLNFNKTEFNSSDAQWYHKLFKERSRLRKEEEKAQWYTNLFKERSEIRKSGEANEWFFERARDRRRKRSFGKYFTYIKKHF